MVIIHQAQIAAVQTAMIMIPISLPSHRNVRHQRPHRHQRRLQHLLRKVVVILVRYSWVGVQPEAGYGCTLLLQGNVGVAKL